MKVCLLFTCILFSLHSFAQTNINESRNSLMFELGKTGLIYNLVFDHQFQNKKIGIRLGAGSNLNKYLNATVFQTGVYYLLGEKKSFFEMGADISYVSVEEHSDDQRSVTLIYPDYPTKTGYANLNLGYRIYGKNTIFRAGVSPGFLKNKFIPGAYISFGFSL